MTFHHSLCITHIEMHDGVCISYEKEGEKLEGAMKFSKNEALSA